MTELLIITAVAGTITFAIAAGLLGWSVLKTTEALQATNEKTQETLRQTMRALLAASLAFDNGTKARLARDALKIDAATHKEPIHPNTPSIPDRGASVVERL